MPSVSENGPPLLIVAAYVYDRGMKRILGVAAAAAYLLAVSGCASPAIEKDATYRDLDGLISAVQATGLKCEGQLQKFPDGSSEYRTCGMNGWAAIYGTTSERDRQVRIQSGSTDSVMVVGPNWIVKAPLGDAKAVSDKLGGTIHE